MFHKKEDPENIGDKPSSMAEVPTQNTVAVDEVFGTIITEDGPNYRNVNWISTSVLMMKTQIGLGVLSIPAAFHTLGMIPGVICLLAIGGITTWSNYVVGTFKLNHREVYGIDDAMKLIFGPIGREIVGAGFALYLIFAAGSGLLSISIGLNAVSTHGACTAIFVVVAAIGIFCIASIRTLARLSWLAWVGLICLLVAVFIVAVAVGVEDKPEDAPPGPWVSDYKLFASPTFIEASSAVSMFVFAYAGTPFFFPIMSEMRDPRQYTKAMVLCQTVVTATYVVIGIIVYYFCGSYVASPALGSAGKMIKIISYAIATPGIWVTSALSTHIVTKYFFVRILRGSRHLAANTMVHWSTWLGLVFIIVIIEYCIASGIPVFGGLVSLIGALLGTLQCFQPLGAMWLYDNWSKGKEQRTPWWMFMVGWSIFVILSGTFLMIAGTWGAISGIITSLNADGATRPWSCADNSGST